MVGGGGGGEELGESRVSFAKYVELQKEDLDVYQNLKVGDVLKVGVSPKKGIIDTLIPSFEADKFVIDGITKLVFVEEEEWVNAGLGYRIEEDITLKLKPKPRKVGHLKTMPREGIYTRELEISAEPFMKRNNFNKRNDDLHALLLNHIYSKDHTSGIIQLDKARSIQGTGDETYETWVKPGKTVQINPFHYDFSRNTRGVNLEGMKFPARSVWTFSTNVRTGEIGDYRDVAVDVAYNIGGKRGIFSSGVDYFKIK